MQQFQVRCLVVQHRTVWFTTCSPNTDGWHGWLHLAWRTICNASVCVSSAARSNSLAIVSSRIFAAFLEDAGKRVLAKNRKSASMSKCHSHKDQRKRGKWTSAKMHSICASTVQKSSCEISFIKTTQMMLNCSRLPLLCAAVVLRYQGSYSILYFCQTIYKQFYSNWYLK